MAGVTPNIRLNLPTYDQAGWDTLMNSNLQILDSLVARAVTLGGTYLGIYTAGNSYVTNNVVTDPADSSLWQAGSNFTTLTTNTFAQERVANPAHWSNVTASTVNAGTSATLAAGSATTAASAATAAGASQTSAATSATNASASATLAANSAASTQNTFRNKLLNPQFAVQQMNLLTVNAGGVAANAYVNDNWQVGSSGAVSLLGQIRAATDAERVAIGDEATAFALQATVANAPGVNDFAVISQAIEGVRALAGKTVTLSFWANALTNGNFLVVEFLQNFGTGGAPSANVVGICQQRFTVNTTLQFYSITATLIPSVAAKTLGTTANTDYLGLNLWMSAGATIGAARAASMGTGAYTLNLFNPQLEVSSAASSFERRPLAVDTAICQRYYETGLVIVGAPTGAAGNSSAGIQYKFSKRIVPTISLTTPGFVNVTSSSTSGTTVNSSIYTAVVTGAGAFSAANTFIADARI